MANKDEKKSANTLVHDTIALTVITLIAGILLGGVYTITKKPIEQQNEKIKAEAYAAVYENAEFVDDKTVDGALVKYNEKLAAGEIKANAMGETLSDVEISEVMKAQVDGADAGYVVTCSAKGYGGSVVLALGVDKDGNILGIRVTTAPTRHPVLDRTVRPHGMSSMSAWQRVTPDFPL